MSADDDQRQQTDAEAVRYRNCGGPFHGLIVVS